MAFLIRNRSSYEIVHITGFMDRYALLTLACKALRKRIIMQMVLLGSDDPLSLKANFRLMRVRLGLMRIMDRFIFISRPIGESCVKAGLPTAKLRYIPQGVDLCRFTPVDEGQKRDIRADLGVSGDMKVVCFVGAVIPRKGVALLIDAWAEIQHRCPNTELIIVGPYEFDGTDENEGYLQAFVQSLRQTISDKALNVRMVGRSDRVESFLQASDVFVLLSKSEGFGNVIIEAMACGIPVVATPMDGVASDTVEHDVTGYIVDTKSDIVTAVESLLTDEAKRRAMGARARENTKRKFQLEHVAGMYCAVYDEIG
jgi:glycosyltransferase involved in cell wall biosynthesis